MGTRTRSLRDDVVRPTGPGDRVSAFVQRYRSLSGRSAGAENDSRVARSDRVTRQHRRHLQRYLTVHGRTKSIRVLDIGAYDRAFGQSLKKTELPCTYYSIEGRVLRRR